MPQSHNQHLTRSSSVDVKDQNINLTHTHIGSCKNLPHEINPCVLGKSKGTFHVGHKDQREEIAKVTGWTRTSPPLVGPVLKSKIHDGTSYDSSSSHTSNPTPTRLDPNPSTNKTHTMNGRRGVHTRKVRGAKGIKCRRQRGSGAA